MGDRDELAPRDRRADLFVAAAQRVGIAIENTMVVGDSVWDMLAAQHARALGIGLLSGAYGEDELARAGAGRCGQAVVDRSIDHYRPVTAT